MNILLWIMIGAGAGWATSKLMLSSSRSRLIAGTLAGVVGALLGGIGMRLLDSASGGDHVNTAAAAVAGALWLAWIVCVVTFSRRPDERRSLELGTVHLRGGSDMLTYGAARDVLVEQLLSDAAAHEAERYDEVGRRYDTIERLPARLCTGARETPRRADLLGWGSTRGIAAGSPVGTAGWTIARTWVSTPPLARSRRSTEQTAQFAATGAG